MKRPDARNTNPKVVRSLGIFSGRTVGGCSCWDFAAWNRIAALPSRRLASKSNSPALPLSGVAVHRANVPAQLQPGGANANFNGQVLAFGRVHRLDQIELALSIASSSVAIEPIVSAGSINSNTEEEDEDDVGPDGQKRRRPKLNRAKLGLSRRRRRREPGAGYGLDGIWARFLG